MAQNRLCFNSTLPLAQFAPRRRTPEINTSPPAINTKIFSLEKEKVNLVTVRSGKNQRLT
jgi:hypothetical protein